MMISGFGYAVQANPKLALGTLIVGVFLAVAVGVSEARKPDPPPIVWTADERAFIKECTGPVASARWCAAQAVSLREVLK